MDIGMGEKPILGQVTPVEEIRERLTIVEVVSEYVQLKQAGRTFKGLCPFHSEKTPSFVVYPEEGRWHCFGGCAAGGDVFSFVMRAENLGFRGALDLLARRVGIELTPASPRAAAERSRRERLRTLLTEAEALYSDLLRSDAGSPARRYLESRQLSPELAAEFALGWAPDAWSTLTDRLKAKGVSEDDLIAAGLARESERGGVYDFFRGRLMIPIRDPAGRPIGFGARTLDPKGQPKYVNSPQTDLFDKSRTLYGLDRAVAGMRESGVAVIVEGYTDVIRAHAAGFTNVVASLGTALTEHHLARLKRYAGTIILALDADAAGRHATVRGVDVAREAVAGAVVPVPTAQGWIRYEQRLEVELKVAVLPHGRDPDDVLRETPDEWAPIIAGAVPVVRFLLDALTADLDLDSPAGKSTATARLTPVLASIPDPVARAAWISELADRLRIDPRAVSAKLASTRPAPQRGRGQGTRASATGAAGPARSGAGRSTSPGGHAGWLLGHLLSAPHLYDAVNAALAQVGQARVALADLEEALDQDLLEAVRTACRGAPPPDTPEEHRIDALPPLHADRMRVLVALAASDPEQPEMERVKTLCQGVLRARLRRCRHGLAQMRFLQADAQTDEDRAVYADRTRSLAGELVALERLVTQPLGYGAGKIDQALVRRTDI